MNKEYVCEKNSIKEALDEIDNFTTLMTNFNEKHDDKYTYSIDLQKQDGKKWLIELKVKR